MANFIVCSFTICKLFITFLRTNHKHSQREWWRESNFVKIFVYMSVVGNLFQCYIWYVSIYGHSFTYHFIVLGRVFVFFFFFGLHHFLLFLREYFMATTIIVFIILPMNRNIIKTYAFVCVNYNIEINACAFSINYFHFKILHSDFINSKYDNTTLNKHL